MNPLLAAILGGLIAGAISIGGIYLQAASVRSKRMDELIAEKKIAAYELAYYYTTQVQSRLPGLDVMALQKILDQEHWFFMNRLYLPGEFPKKWLQMRDYLMELQGWRNDPTKTADEKLDFAKRIRDIAASAIDEIYADLDLKRISLD